MRDTVGLFLKGVVIGLANIIPGVSGGTMALVLGIYDRLIHAVGRLGPRSVRAFGAALRGPGKMRRLADLSREHEIWFLGCIGVGALAAIVAASRVMNALYREHHDPTYGFFWGLIAASIVVPLSLVSRRSWKELVWALIAVAATVGIDASLSGDARVEAAQKKADMRSESSTEAEVAEVPADHSAGHLVLLALAGMVAISAMVLPGVSGSFVMLLFGLYFELLDAVIRVDVVALGAFALGCVVGLAFFTRLLAYLLDRFRSPTMAFLVGLMVGSLWSIWPFKSYVEIDKVRVDKANIWPHALGANEVGTIVAALVGAAIVLAFFRYERARRTEERAGA